MTYAVIWCWPYIHYCSPVFKCSIWYHWSWYHFGPFSNLGRYSGMALQWFRSCLLYWHCLCKVSCKSYLLWVPQSLVWYTFLNELFCDFIWFYNVLSLLLVIVISFTLCLVSWVRLIPFMFQMGCFYCNHFVTVFWNVLYI